MSKRVAKKDLVTLDDGLPARKAHTWFRDKHKLLRDYVTMFAGPRKKWPNSFFLDLYCDYGRCVEDETGEVCDGSTLVALKAMRERGAEFSKIYINDLSSDAVGACAERCRAEGFEVIPLNLDASEAVEQIADREKRRGLNLAFLDPFSLSALPFSVVDGLSKIGNTDMMVHVSIFDLRRNFGRFNDQSLDGLDRFAPGWRDRFNLTADLETNRRAAVEHWVKLLADRGYLETERWKNFPASGPLIYRMVLLAKRQIALKFWEGALDAKPQRRLF